MQKHFPQLMHKQNLLQKVLEFQDSARCPPDRLPFIERTAPSPRRTSEKQGTRTGLSRFGLPAHPSPGSLLGSEILEHDVAFLIDSAAGGILDLAPAVSSILQNGDHGSISGAGLGLIAGARAGADIQAAGGSSDHRLRVGSQGPGCTGALSTLSGALLSTPAGGDVGAGAVASTLDGTLGGLPTRSGGDGDGAVAA